MMLTNLQLTGLILLTICLHKIFKYLSNPRKITN